MERLQHLIGKLQEQFEQKAPLSQMLATLRLIEAELAAGSNKSSTLHLHHSSKVAVVMPPAMKYNALNEEEDAMAPIENIVQSVQKVGSGTSVRNLEQVDWILDPLAEIPTLSHQQEGRELNDVIGSNRASINDKLKENVLELAAALKEAPVRELKKAIGVNDRYVFINELFRGDEVMYERSIKTINNFRILPEAEYWMERELKIKLGWDDSREITKHFYQLVRRRFS
jgi:hypothetical protein